MKNCLLLLIGMVFFLPGCHRKEKEPGKKFISVLSLIREQVAHVDTSLYSIVKVVSTDSLHHDTTYIAREQFGAVANEFLEIPDLSDSKVAKRYKEEPAIYDEMLNRVIITYLPVDPAREEFKRQELLATPVPGEDSKINNILIVREISNRDSFLQKNMLWQMDKYFQIVTRSQKPGQPEIITTTRVTWNEDTNQ
jgi:hypothetical protein